jgi:hypothetical protein
MAKNPITGLDFPKNYYRPTAQPIAPGTPAFAPGYMASQAVPAQGNLPASYTPTTPEDLERRRQQAPGGPAQGGPEGLFRTSPYPKWARNIFQQASQYGLKGLLGFQQPTGAPDTSGFDPIEQHYLNQFSSNVSVPSINARLTAMGGGRGPEAQATFTQSYHDLLGQLAAQRAQWGQAQQQYGLASRQQELGRLGALFGAGLVPQYDYSMQGEAPGFSENLGSTALRYGPAIAGGIAGGIGGGPAGALAGASAGYGLGQGLTQPQRTPGIPNSIYSPYNPNAMRGTLGQSGAYTPFQLD